MKKISVFSVIAVLTMPVMAAQDVHKMYGEEPMDVASPELVAQYEQQFKTDANQKTQETAKEEVTEVEKIKKVKKVKEIEEVEEVKEEPKYLMFEEPKYEEPSNPKIRFPHGMQFGVGISPTSGLNGFIGYNNKNFDSFWAKRFGIRFDFATMSPIKSKLNKRINKAIGDEGVEIEDALTIDNFKLDAKHYGAMIDFYPFGDTWFLGGWRVSGGYFTGKLDLDADLHGTQKVGKIEFELDGKKFTYDGDEMHGKATIDWKYKGPYAGTGFDLGLFWGFKIYFDAGVVFTDRTAKIDLDIPLDGLRNEFGTLIEKDSADATIQAAYAEFETAKDKALADARKEIKDYPYYPIVKLGFMYRF